MSQLEKVLYTLGASGLLRSHRLRRIVVLLVAGATLVLNQANPVSVFGYPNPVGAGRTISARLALRAVVCVPSRVFLMLTKHSASLHSWLLLIGTSRSRLQRFCFSNARL